MDFKRGTLICFPKCQRDQSLRKVTASVRVFFQHKLSHWDAGAAGTDVQPRAALLCPPVPSLAKACDLRS